MPVDRIRKLHLRAMELCEKGRWQAAVPVLQSLTALEPGNVALLNNLGLALWQAGNPAEAEPVFRKALKLEPGNRDLSLQHGEVLCELRRWSEGAEALQFGMPAASGEYRMACKSKLALALTHTGNVAASARLWRSIVRKEPRNALAWNGLANAQRRLGQIRAAMHSLTRITEIDFPSANLHSNLLLTLLSNPSATPDFIYEQHRDWGRRHTVNVPQLPAPPVSRYRRRLRIGYVSADFGNHSVRFFIEPLLCHHNRSRFDVHLFVNDRDSIASTNALRSRLLEVGRTWWHDIHALDDDATARLIRKLGIDILIDLSGHTAGHRLGVFARNPALVQATYLGYAASTGLKAIDFRITDSFADPPGETERWHSETLLRVDPCFLSYSPPAEAPEPLRGRRSHVAFGSFAMLVRISPRMIRLWARILNAVPGSTLVLKSKVFDDPESRAVTLKRLAASGLPVDRLRALGFETARGDHMGRYSEIDVVLDTYPYCGTTTTCEALWMGLPMVTLCGKTHASRVSGSIFSQLGREEWIAYTEDDYVRKAISLAGSGEFRTADRRKSRAKMAESPLMDHARHAARFEAALSNGYKDIGSKHL